MVTVNEKFQEAMEFFSTPFVSTIKEYTFEDARNEISRAFEHRESERAWLSFVEENICTNTGDCLGWTLDDAMRMVEYANNEVDLAIEKAYNAGRLF
jgi:hypothetical protein